MEETAYWFHTPEGQEKIMFVPVNHCDHERKSSSLSHSGGWTQKETVMKVAPEAPVTFADPSHEDWEEEGRLPLSDLEEGAVITGYISDIWLYHGCQIDLGYEYDG